MKIGTTLFALFLLSALTSHLCSAGALVDVDGQPLQNGGLYYILPAIRGRGGGITLAATGNEPCPYTVVQAPFGSGLQVKISTPLKILFLSEGHLLDLDFTSFYWCAPVPRWSVVDGLSEGPAVKLLASYENTADGLFGIRAVDGFGDAFKIVFCRNDSTGKCSDIGLYIDNNGVRRLVVKENDPLIVVFKNVAAVDAVAA